MADLQAVKARSQVIWGSGNYLAIGSRIAVVAENLCDAVPVRADQKVLDVATGTGNAALAAARRFAHVVAIDFVPEMLDLARIRARAEGLAVDFRVGDAEALDVESESIDVVLSTCGVMFAPDQEKAASELLRVCKPGGKIGMVNWSADGFIGALFRMQAGLVPPPEGVKPAVRWGTQLGLQELLGNEVAIAAPTRTFWWRFPSVESWIDYWVVTYGPTVKLIETLGKGGETRVRAGLRECVKQYNRAKDGTADIQQDYLEVIVTKPN